MPPRARGIGAAWGGKKEGGHLMRITSEEGGRAACRSFLLGATVVAPVGQSQG